MSQALALWDGFSAVPPELKIGLLIVALVVLGYAGYLIRVLVDRVRLIDIRVDLRTAEEKRS